MPRSKVISISRPYDARHVTGVSVSGPIGQPSQAHQSFALQLEPDEIPTHLNISAQPQVPKRSHTIAHTLSRPSLRLKTSISRLRARSSSNSPDTHRKRECDFALEPRASALPPRLPAIETLGASQTGPKISAPTRPKRADSGTAIDFDDVPFERRPLGFKEILAVKSFDERMMLYKKAREYWATADHGLEDWVESSRFRRPLVQL